MLSKEKILLIGVTVLSGIAVLLFSFSFDIFQYGDNCGYISLAIAFINGEGFTDPAIPGHLHFLWWPPGFPLFISLFYKLFGSQWSFLKLLIFIILYASFTLYALTIYKKENNFIKAALILITLCFSSGIHLLSSYLYSETFYIACSLLFVFLWYKWHKKFSIVKVIIVSLFAAYVASVRLVGISLVLALIVYFLFVKTANAHKKWYYLIPLVMLIIYGYIFLFVPQIRVESFRTAVGLHPQIGSDLTGTYHGDQVTAASLLSFHVGRFLHSLRGYTFTLIPQALIRSVYDLYDMNKLKALFMLIITSMTFIGWCITLRKNKLVNIYVGFYMIISFLHGPCYIRLIVPIIPFLFFYFYSGWELIIKFFIQKERIAIFILTIIWIFVVFDNALRTFTDPHRTMPPQFGDHQFQQCIEWVVENAKPKDTVACQIHSYLYLKRGQYCLPYNYAKTANEFMSYLDENKVKYIIVSPFYKRAHYTYMNRTREAVDNYPYNFKKAFKGDNGESYVLEYIPETLSE